MPFHFQVCSRETGHRGVASAGMLLRTWLVLAISCSCAGATSGQAPSISWSNNLLTFADSRLPGGKLEIWYLEAFCRSGAHDREWAKTTLPHKTTLIHAEPTLLRFHTQVEPGLEVDHQVQSTTDGLDLRFELTNTGKAWVDLQWFEPACIRVAAFTGCSQSNYTSRSFIFTPKGLTKLDQLRRTSEARYLGGQVYLPGDVKQSDANPRPVCLDHPVNGLIGCFSADNRLLLATASDRTHELFEGVYVCLHSDPRVNGLAPQEKRQVRSKIYLLPNDPAELLARYQRDFPKTGKEW